VALRILKQTDELETDVACLRFLLLRMSLECARTGRGRHVGEGGFFCFANLMMVSRGRAELEDEAVEE
jgi:hypothetical protein